MSDTGAAVAIFIAIGAIGAIGCARTWVGLRTDIATDPPFSRTGSKVTLCTLATRY